MRALVLRDGLDQPRPLAQLQSQLADARLQQQLPPPGPVALDCGTWTIGVQELKAMVQALAEQELALQRLLCSDPHTRVAAAALGFAWDVPQERQDSARSHAGLRIHQGTLRAGDVLEAEASVLVLGDVNPGAQVIAGGHVLVWGTLRGVAHAGKNGDTKARIVALQLRPLQLRIADCIARGPDELPLAGLAEQAEIEAGVIAINPAAAHWPLSG